MSNRFTDNVTPLDAATLNQLEDDLTVSSWAKASSKPSYTPGEIGAATAAQGTKADNAIPGAQKGAANGVAALDANSKIPSANIPATGQTTIGGVKMWMSGTTLNISTT